MPRPWQHLFWQVPSLGLQQTAPRLSEVALGGPKTWLLVLPLQGQLLLWLLLQLLMVRMQC